MLEHTSKLHCASYSTALLLPLPSSSPPPLLPSFLTTFSSSAHRQDLLQLVAYRTVDPLSGTADEEGAHGEGTRAPIWRADVEDREGAETEAEAHPQGGASGAAPVVRVFAAEEGKGQTRREQVLAQLMGMGFSKTACNWAIERHGLTKAGTAF